MKDTYHFGASEEMVSYAARCARDMNMEPYYLYDRKTFQGTLRMSVFQKRKRMSL